MKREKELAGLVDAFVEMSDTLVEDYDVVDLLQRLVDHTASLLAADAVGLLLADQRGGLQLVAASSEQARPMELFQLQNDEGPCLDCFHSGHPVMIADLSESATRWPRFSAKAREHGFQAVHALPLRLRDQTIGAMNLFHNNPGALPDDDARIGQALADVATIGILQERLNRHHEALSEQLQRALNSRVAIEQAKGVLAERGQIDMDAAFAQLRSHARNNNLRLADVAGAVADGRLDTTEILTPTQRS